MYKYKVVSVAIICNDYDNHNDEDDIIMNKRELSCFEKLSEAIEYIDNFTSTDDQCGHQTSMKEYMAYCDMLDMGEPYITVWWQRNGRSIRMYNPSDNQTRPEKDYVSIDVVSEIRIYPLTGRYSME